MRSLGRKKIPAKPESSVTGAPRALLIEADGDYAAAMQACLETAGCSVEIHGSVTAALARLGRSPVEVVVWGVASDEADRAATVEQLRVAAKCPLVLVDEAVADARASYESGADQFLPKPFVPGALVGAVKSALRAHGPSSAISVASRFEIAGTVFEATDRRITTPDGGELTLTRREWALVTFMLGHSNRYFSAADLVREAWGTVNLAEEQLRTYIARVRRKANGFDMPFVIESRQGLGYRLVLSENAVAP